MATIDTSVSLIVRPANGMDLGVCWNEWSRLIMPTSPDEPVCPKFQPNIFDPSRCHDCLRQRHLHSGAGESTEVALQQKTTLETRAGNKTDISHKTENGIGNCIGQSKGVLLTPIPSQAEEKDTSSKEDSDSVVSSYCDVRGGQTGYRESSLCILSPDCALYICEGEEDCSTVSSRDQSDYQEFSSSISTEDDEYLPAQRDSTHFTMTRLDPPPHRPNPRAWMDEARSKDAFSRRSGLNEDKGKRESGYFSLGRASGASSIRDKSPPSPYRHIERGHPLFKLRNVEPKDAVPFRNPNLGVASERIIPEPVIDDEPVEIIPPDPYEVAIEVEAQVGPRSPSPTPFKIAESLASTGRKGAASVYGRRSPTQMSSYQPSRQTSAVPSRSASPSRTSLGFRRSESTTSLNRHNYDGGGRIKGAEMASKSSLQSTYARRGESGTMPRNFKSYTSAVKTQSNTVSDFRNALRKSEGGLVNGRGQPSRNSSPTRGDYNPPGQMSLRKTETNSSTSYARSREERASAPSHKLADSTRNIRSASLPRRTHDTSSHSVLHKSESIWSLNGRGHPGRCGSPVREGYDIESQALIRSQINNYGTNEDEDETLSMSPTKNYEMPSKSMLRKTDTESINIRGHDSRSSSPGRRGYNSSSQLRRADTSGSLYSRGHESRSSSPGRRGFESSRQLQRTETSGSLYSRGESRNSSPVRRNFEGSTQSLLQKTSSRSDRNLSRSTSPSRRSQEPPERSLRTSESIMHSHSPPQRGLRDPPGYSVLRNATNGDFSRSFQRKETETKSETYHSSRSWRESAHTNRSTSVSRAASPSRQSSTGNRVSYVTMEKHKNTGSVRSVGRRRSNEDHHPSPVDKRSSRAWSPSNSQVDLRRHTSSQSSMESSESGQLSAGSTGRNREEYAIMADLPKVKKVQQKEGSSQPERTNVQLFKPASHSVTKQPSREWDDTWDTEWPYGGSGYLSRAHSTTSLHRSGSPTTEEGTWKSNQHRSEQMQVCVSISALHVDDSGLVCLFLEFGKNNFIV
ncbi:serine/arginine repetitive matrix protein 2 [Boleophthalmus pectinirostris]|uniref:serine/arginine repetitive matrix protein 2 n=1 Tax=Boleophthalmus pectinirostris TaxID=150288 RepID=UPI002431949F|nr:serine/arginine repetitive matrix protein 2 [Boleophthalmus pectinirostris]